MVLPDQVDDLIVESQKRDLKTGDDDVLIVAGISDDGAARRVARQILEPAAPFQPEPRPIVGLYSSGDPAGPSPYTESRSKYG